MTGRYLVEVLLEDAFYDAVVALVRRPLGVDHPKLQERTVDFSRFSGDDLAGATHLFCCLGTTIRKAGSKAAFQSVDYDYAIGFARAGLEAGAKRLMLISSVGADARAGNFYLRVKGELERDVERLDFAAIHIFRPSFLMGKRDEPRPGEEWGIKLARAFEWLLAGGLRKYRPMPAGTLAAAMAAAGERGATGRHVHHYDQIVRLAGS